MIHNLSLTVRGNFKIRVNWWTGNCCCLDLIETPSALRGATRIILPKNVFFNSLKIVSYPVFKPSLLNWTLSYGFSCLFVVDPPIDLDFFFFPYFVCPLFDLHSSLLAQWLCLFWFHKIQLKNRRFSFVCFPRIDQFAHLQGFSSPSVKGSSLVQTGQNEMAWVRARARTLWLAAAKLESGGGKQKDEKKKKRWAGL